MASISLVSAGGNVTIDIPVGATYNLTLPPNIGTPGQFLQTTVNGTVWTSVTGSTTPNLFQVLTVGNNSEGLGIENAGFINLGNATISVNSGNLLSELSSATAAFIVEVNNQGATRGNNAVDLQLSRNNSSQVASGANSVLIGGANNTVNGDFSGILAGADSTVSGVTSAIVGGQYNTVGGVASAIVGGQYNNVSGNNSVSIGGNHNSVSGNNSFAAGATSNVLHDNSFVWNSAVGGTTLSTTASGQFLVNAGAGGVVINSSGSVTFGTRGGGPLILPNSVGLSGQLLSTLGSGNLTWYTPNFLTSVATPNLAQVLEAGNDANNQSITDVASISLVSTGGNVTIDIPVGATYNLTLPPNIGTPGQFLQTTVNGTVWTSVTGSSTPNLFQVLTQGNDGGDLPITDIASLTLKTVAGSVTLSANSGANYSLTLPASSIALGRVFR